MVESATGAIIILVFYIIAESVNRLGNSVGKTSA